MDLDVLESVEIGHTGVGHGAGWFLDKVVIYEKRSGEEEEGKVGRVFPCCRWLDDHEDDKKTCRNLNMICEYKLYTIIPLILRQFD